MSKIIVLGGDGFCGWPTSLRLSKLGHEVMIIDNLSRRYIDRDLDCESLTPIKSIKERIATWKRVSGKSLRFMEIDIADFSNYKAILEILKDFEPDTIIHFAEQRAAPYSMKSAGHKMYTVGNNVNGTNNILCAIVESGLDIHLVHLGTMGVYGYTSTEKGIPEGYVEYLGKEVIHPYNPGSVYHMTKCQDSIMFYFYNKNDKIRITDLHQGIIWGTNTEETLLHDDLINRFDYDGDYGTVLNRFLMQAAVGHPLTVYGIGGQTRAFIHIKNTVDCVVLALDNPPNYGDRVEIFNQVTECHNVGQLANIVSELSGAEIRYYSNPRNEDLENTLKVQNNKFLDLGLNVVTLSNGLLEEIVDIAAKYKDRCDKSKIICTSLWDTDKKIDEVGKTCVN